MSFCSACTVVVEMSVAYDDDPFHPRSDFRICEVPLSANTRIGGQLTPHGMYLFSS